MANGKLFGTNYSPPDLVAKMTGTAKYAEDFRAEGMLMAKLLMSPMPHARVRSIDTRAAEAMEGVHAILTADDLPETDDLVGGDRALTMEPMYQGEPILAVAAVDEQTAANAIEAIRVDYEPLPFVIDPIESLRPGGPNARVGGNTVKDRSEVVEIKWTAQDFADAGENMPMGQPEEEFELGDVAKGFEEADLVLDETLYHQSQTHHPLEPRSCMAYWQNDKLYIHPSTQSAQRTAGIVARQVGVDPTQVVLIAEYCGGGFGSKIGGTVNMAIAALLSKKAGRPVMHRVTRAEENAYGRARPGFQGRIKVGFRADGRVTAFDMYLIQDNGPYGRSGDFTSASRCVSLNYTPLNMRFRGISVLTNTPPRAAQRAPGGVQITAMVEPVIDKAAKELNVDRIAIRKINAPDNDTVYGSNQHNVTSAYVRETLDKAAEMVNWEEFKKYSGQTNGHKSTGVGVALSSYVAGSRGFDGLMLIKPDGNLYVHQGIGNLGTHSTFDTARVACDVLDIPWENTVVVWGNTGKHLPHSSVQAGSQTTHAHTRTNLAAANTLKRNLQEIAAKDFGGSPDGYDVSGGRVHRKGNPSSGMTLARAAERAIELGGKYDGQEMAEDLNEWTKTAVAGLAGQGALGAAKDNYGGDGDLWSFVVGVAKVEVDRETGAVELQHYTAVCDTGSVINPRGLKAQILGGGACDSFCAMNDLKILTAFLVVGSGLVGLAMAYYYRARRLARLFDEQAEELRSLLKKILRIEEELEFVLEFIREIPHLTGELNNQMNPRGLPEVLLNVVTRTFKPEQAVVLIRRRKTLAQPDGDNQFVAAAVAAPRSTCAHGMVIGMGEGELGYIAQQQRVLDRPGLEREAASYRNIRAKGLAAFRPDLAAPMHINDKTMGVLALRRPERQKPYSVDVFRVIAQMGAFALNNLAAYTEVKSVADVDPLTKIWNKGVLSFRLGEVVFDAEENKHNLSVFIFDIDNFKNYNDINGHVAGDRLLQLLARLVKEQTRIDDIFGRFGGEEFLLILPRKTKSQAKITGEKIRAAVEEYDFPFGDKQPLGKLTISGGVACFPDDGRNSSELIRAADQALYEAKRLGRNRVEAAGHISLAKS